MCFTLYSFVLAADNLINLGPLPSSGMRIMAWLPRPDLIGVCECSCQGSDLSENTAKSRCFDRNANGHKSPDP